LRDIDHVDRNQTFLDLGARTTERSSIHRVDAVDAVADEGALTPAHYLATEADAARQIAQAVVVIDEGIEDLGAGSLRSFLAVGVADVLVQSGLVLQLEVVPVLAANEGTKIAVFQFEVVGTLEDLREGLATLEIQTVVVTGLGVAGARLVANGIGATNQLVVRLGGGPAGADGHGGVQLTFDLADIEIDCVGRGGNAQRYCQGQSVRLEDSVPFCCCHRALLGYGPKWRHPTEPV